MLKYMIRYKFSILLAILIVLLSLLPGSSFPEADIFSIRFLDKIIHFGMYMLFGLVILLESRCHSGCLRIHLGLMVLVLLASAVIELMQATIVASRSAEWLDLLANLSGLITGYLSYRLMLRIRIVRTTRS